MNHELVLDIIGLVVVLVALPSALFVILYARPPISNPWTAYLTHAIALAYIMASGFRYHLPIDVHVGLLVLAVVMGAYPPWWLIWSKRRGRPDAPID